MTTNKEEFDLFVIGGGSGGVRCARIAAQRGAKVGIVERRSWGGTCVNIGCVPKKLLTYAAAYAAEFEDARAYGWEVTAGPHDWARLIAAKDREIARLNGIYVSLLEKSGVSLFTGEARFIDAHTVEIGPSPLDPGAPIRTVRAKAIVIATGSTPTKLDIPGAEHAVVSDQAFFLKDRPKRVAILGSGYIGIEFAGIFAGLGSQVDLVYRRDLPLRGFDHELRAQLAESLPLNGVTVHPGSEPARIEKAGEAYRLHLKDGRVIGTDLVFMATGRHPDLSSLRLERAGVRVEKGRIPADPALSETNVSGIYAIGDVTDNFNLTPTAIAEGHLLAERLFGGTERDWAFGTVPKAVFFTHPLASVGLTEEEARESHDLDVYTARFGTLRQSLSGRAGKVFMKLVVDSASRIVLGAHMIGPDAPEIIQMLAVAVTAKLTKRDLDRTVALHPTTAEEFVTMREPTRHVARHTA